ncbi:TKL protein kinase [Saprolegnia diclina VS20]|uniref:TKL protein kinase n=1 Tax=Saprolegnia diclina (strain VS20) TaxID=1156394 RepID=T0QJ16_SAPDV|nr:TKL protein kinase [Saprolegnia diclina VS20]EQC33745.1 TKL protein kinase [Saprolegnia diclina VS20]|eukprot:XP_008612968.1 TKL protein kinase [Saprolegnia diclina VS20]
MTILGAFACVQLPLDAVVFHASPLYERKNVFRGVYNSSTNIALRRFPKHSVDAKRDVFVQHISLLSRLQHDNVVSFVGCCMDAHDNLYIAMEWMDGGSLRSVLTSPSVHWTWASHGLAAARSVCVAMQYLRSHAINDGVYPHTLTSATVFFPRDANAMCKVGDIGLAALASEEMLPLCTVPTWLAPEVLRGDCVQSEAADVYSFGMLLYELFTQKRPFTNYRSRMQLLISIVYDGARPTLPEAAPQRILEIYHACVDAQPALRPTFRHLLGAFSCIRDDAVA